jgi:F-type H+-transporting ATPase subunit b
MVAEAKDIASGEAEKIMTAAAAQIEGAKMAAVTELKNHVAQIAVDMAEKVLRSELKDPAGQKASIDRALEDVKLN